MPRSDADDKLRQGQTVKEAIDRCIVLAEVRRNQVDQSTPEGRAQGREFSLAITALEDAQMRYARGRAMQDGKFVPADLDRVSDTTGDRPLIGHPEGRPRPE